MCKYFFRIAAMMVVILTTCEFCAAQQNIDEKYIADQISKEQEYTLLLWSLSTNKAPKDSIGKWKMAHIKLMFELQAEGKVSFFGAVAKDPSIVGMAIFNTSDATEVKQQVEKDPFVLNNILTYRLSKWYCVPEQKLLPSSVGNK